MSNPGRGQIIANHEHLIFLDVLRESAVTNMLGAGPYLQREFGLDKYEARAILRQWMDTFAERHPVETKR